MVNYLLPGVLANQRAQRQSLGLQGGSATQHFELRADDYEENRHFLLAQYFRNNYNKAMSNLPVVNSTGADITDGSMGNQPNWFYHRNTGMWLA